MQPLTKVLFTLQHITRAAVSLQSMLSHVIKAVGKIQATELCSHNRLLSMQS